MLQLCEEGPTIAFREKAECSAQASCLPLLRASLESRTGTRRANRWRGKTKMDAARGCRGERQRALVTT